MKLVCSDIISWFHHDNTSDLSLVLQILTQIQIFIIHQTSGWCKFMSSFWLIALKLCWGPNQGPLRTFYNAFMLSNELWHVFLHHIKTPPGFYFLKSCSFLWDCGSFRCSPSHSGQQRLARDFVISYRRFTEGNHQTGSKEKLYFSLRSFPTVASSRSAVYLNIEHRSEPLRCDWYCGVIFFTDSEPTGFQSSALAVFTDSSGQLSHPGEGGCQIWVISVSLLFVWRFEEWGFTWIVVRSDKKHSIIEGILCMSWF